MNHTVIKRVIADMYEVIRENHIVKRSYSFEENANYVLVGLRRAGKSTLMYKRVQDLIASGCQWEQIIYVNFEDDRLTGFRREEFDDILESANELTSKEHFYFFDEIQNVDGWEHFARRMADHNEHVWITGSNAKMLSREIEASLGGRYLPMMVMPFSLPEMLDYAKIPHEGSALYQTAVIGQIRAMAQEYLQNGGLPESFRFKIKRPYIQNVYDKVLLGDIVARNKVMNPSALRLLIKKTAETLMHEISYNKLAGSVRAVGVKCSTDVAITYMGYAQEAYLLFHTSNYVAKFAEKESTPRFYFMDNGLLSLFLVDKSSALLENAVAVQLHRRYSEVYYYHSSVTGIDVDFYIPETKTAIQVTWSLDENSREREIRSLAQLYHKFDGVQHCLIVTAEDSLTIRQENMVCQVIPLYQFLLQETD